MTDIELAMAELDAFVSFMLDEVLREEDLQRFERIVLRIRAEQRYREVRRTGAG